MSFIPKYSITPEIVQALARIEVTRHQILATPITASLITSLRESARLAATHHSTAIEGNPSTAAITAPNSRYTVYTPNQANTPMVIC